MNVLVVGVGAVGQVSGRHFQAGGARTAFLVRPRYADAARAGFLLYPHNRRKSVRQTPVPFRGCEVFEQQDTALAAGPWDVVVLAVSSVALASGSWLAELGAALPDATLLGFGAGHMDVARVQSVSPRNKVAWGMISLCSYQAPLAGEALPEPGIAYWIPWASPLAFSGHRADEIGAVLAAGGMPTRVSANVSREMAFAGAILEKTVMALEISGGSFDTLAADKALLRLAHRAMCDAWALAIHTHGGRRPWVTHVIGPSSLRALMRLSRPLVPFDLQLFLDFHYRKVADQTLAVCTSQLEAARAAGTPHAALEGLLDRLVDRRSVDRS